MTAVLSQLALWATFGVIAVLAFPVMNLEDRWADQRGRARDRRSNYQHRSTR